MLFGDLWVKILGALLALGVVVCAVVAYFCLMAKDPHLLQSEEFQIQNKMLELVQGQGLTKQIGLDDVIMVSDNVGNVSDGKEGE